MMYLPFREPLAGGVLSPSSSVLRADRSGGWLPDPPALEPPVLALVDMVCDTRQIEGDGADTVDTVLATDKTSGGWGDKERSGGDAMALKAKSGWAQKENAEAFLVGTARLGGAKGGPA